MTNVLLYSRGAIEGNSLSYQEEMMILHCKKNNYNVIKSYKEDYSATTFNRPEWNSLKSYLKNNKGTVDKILILRFDRFCRDITLALKEIESLKELNIEVEFIENSFTNLDFNLLSIGIPEIAHYKFSKRTKEGLHHARIKGCYTSKAPMGYKNHRIRYESTLAFNEHSNTIKQLFKLFAEGKYSISEIRIILKKKGINKSTRDLKKILTNRVYLGEIHVPAFKEHKETYVKGLHEPLITKDVFEKANKLILLQNN